VALTGDTGTGKSAFGNAYFGRRVFEESDSPDPVTLEMTLSLQ
jgi:predicted GTPase